MYSPLRFVALALCFALVACDSAVTPPTTDVDARAPVGVTTLRVDAAGQTTIGRQDRLDVCHLDEESSTFRLLTVAAPALRAHLAHGDGLPGGRVPGDTEYAFDGACRRVPISFSCDVERGVTDEGEPTLRVTAVVYDPARLPIEVVVSEIIGNGAFYGPDEYVTADGVIVGFSATFIGASPTTEAQARLLLAGGGATAASCGPYPIGAPVPA